MSIWSRLLNRKSGSFGLSKTLAPVNPKPQLLQLEDRVVPTNGIKVFMIDGFTGSGLTNTTTAKIVEGIVNGSNEVASQDDIEIYTTNWNGDDNSSNPGNFLNETNVGTFLPLDITNTRILGMDVPTGVGIAPFVSPNPVSPTQHISYLSNYIETNTTDNDFVVIIGHSLGGNTALKIANLVSREIDLLITLDPVGFSKDNNPLIIGREILPPIGNIEFGGTTFFTGFGSIYIGASLNTNFNSLNTEYGYPGSRKGLEGPKNGNVKYFMNRWQENYPFPFDLNNGSLPNTTKGDISNIAKVGSLPVLAQRDASEMMDSSGLNKRFRKATGIDWIFGKTHPEIIVKEIDTKIPINFKGDTQKINIPDGIKLANVSSNNHGGFDSVVIDDYVQAEITAALEALTPMAPIVSAGPDLFGILEGSTTTITQATATDPNLDDILTYSWHCSSLPSNVNPSDIFITGADTLKPTITVPDNGSYEFTLVVDDGFGQSFSTFTMFVDNVSPTVTVTNVPTIVSQFDAFFGVNIFDPGIYDAPSVTVDYGDGQTDTNLPGSGPFRHTYQTPGTYTVNITATDKDLGVGTATRQVTVKSFGIVTNPNGGGDMLAVGGTPGVDEIHLNTLDGETFSGTVNGETIGPVVVSSHAASIRTVAGKDFVALGLGQGKKGIPTKVNVDLGAGNDKFASFSQTAGASARTLGNGLYQYTYFGGGNAYVAVIGNETPIIEPNVDDSYVAALYHKLLERNPSKAEVKVWSKQFARETYEHIAHNIFYSVERSAKTVNNWYKTYLGRTPSQAEAQPWMSLIVAGKNEEQILSKFLGSKEYIARQGSGTAFINSLYNHFLGRNASQAAINSWFRDYGNPPNYYEVAKAILTSKEYQVREITSYYDRFLDRHQAPVAGFANPKAFSRQGVGPREVSDWIFANVSPHAARYQMLWSREFIKNGL